MRRSLNETEKEKKKGLDTSEKIPTTFYCSEEFRKITSADAALSRPFSFVNLTSPKKINLHIRSYVDYYGGYAEHGRQAILGLDNTGSYNIKLTPIKTPIDIDPIAWDRMNWFTKNPNFKLKDSIFITIAGPGWLQKKYLSESRINIGWTMVESQEAHPQIIDWLNNADYILCPTDTDIRRFQDCKIELIKMHLGYDENLYNQKSEPLDISNIRGKYIFGVLGSWNDRKNVKGIIQAFAEKFKDNDKVALLLCCKYGTRPWGVEKDNDERWTIKYEFQDYLNEIDMCMEECPHIVLLDIPLHESLMPLLMARFDCLVGFSMGESTWLPGLQAMAMGIPIIQLDADTNGCQEYLHDVGYLCENYEHEIAGPELVEGTSEYYEDQAFARGDVNELAEMMYMVYKENDRYSNRVRLGLKKSKDWTWEKSIENLDSFLRRL